MPTADVAVRPHTKQVTGATCFGTEFIVYRQRAPIVAMSQSVTRAIPAKTLCICMPIQDRHHQQAYRNDPSHVRSLSRLKIASVVPVARVKLRMDSTDEEKSNRPRPRPELFCYTDADAHLCRIAAELIPTRLYRCHRQECR